MLTGSVCIVSKIRAKMSTLHAVAPIPAFMAGSMRCLQNCATIVALAFQGIGFAFNTPSQKETRKEQRAQCTRCSELAFRFSNPNRGHASDTSDARTSGDLGDIAFPSRSAGWHNRSSLCSSGAPGTQVGQYRRRNPVPEGKLLALARASCQFLQSCRAHRRRSLVCSMFS
jgi:hypothetical protein